MKAAGTRKYALLPILAQRKSQEILPVSTSKQNNTTCTARGKRNLTDNIFSQPQKPLTKVSLNMTSDHIWPYLSISHHVSFLLLITRHPTSHPTSLITSPAFHWFFRSRRLYRLSDCLTFGLLWTCFPKKKGCKVARCCTPRVSCVFLSTFYP